MNDLKVRRWTGAFGIASGVVLVVAIPLYYPFVRGFVERLRLRLRDAGKTSTFTPGKYCGRNLLSAA